MDGWMDGEGARERERGREGWRERCVNMLQIAWLNVYDDIGRTNAVCFITELQIYHLFIATASSFQPTDIHRIMHLACASN